MLGEINIIKTKSTNYFKLLNITDSATLRVISLFGSAQMFMNFYIRFTEIVMKLFKIIQNVLL